MPVCLPYFQATEDYMYSDKGCGNLLYAANLQKFKDLNSKKKAFIHFTTTGTDLYAAPLMLKSPVDFAIASSSQLAYYVSLQNPSSLMKRLILNSK